MSTTMVSLLVAVASLGQISVSPIPKQELEYQEQVFQQWWGQQLVQTLDDLPSDGSVPTFRTPYSGYDYPDRAGGTMVAMRKYDQAFHSGRTLAYDFERIDVGAHKSRRAGGLGGPGEFTTRRGLFGRLRQVRIRSSEPPTPHWYGHCNGWTAAAIRHAEPQRSVTRNGVVFTPADIKGLLAEIYMYTDTEFLGGTDAVIHPAVLHLTLTNWLGRGDHPIGVEAALGEVVVNYPIYNYKSTVTKQNRAAEVKLTATYAMNVNMETNQGPKFNRQMYFHYLLDLDSEGKIIGGRYYNDSARVDMLWAPLKPIQGGKKGNERGNPHLDVKTVLAIWRESVSEDVRNQWLNIDPTDEDRVIRPDEENLATAEATPAAEPPAADSDSARSGDGANSSPVAAPPVDSSPAVATTPAPANSATETPSPAPETTPAPETAPANEPAAAETAPPAPAPQPVPTSEP